MTLFAKPPPENTARIRFTKGNTLLSEAIANETQFTFAHSECVLNDGTIITSLIGAGIHRYPNDEQYNKGTIIQQFIDLPMTEPQYQEWKHYLFRLVGKDYDAEGALGIMLYLPLHERGKYICSMVVVNSLIHTNWCQITDRNTVLSPFQLYEMLKSDKRCIVHPIEYGMAA